MVLPSSKDYPSNKPTKLNHPKNEYIHKVLPEVGPCTIDNIIQAKVSAIPRYVPDANLLHLCSVPGVDLSRSKQAFGCPSIRQLWIQLRDPNEHVMQQALERLELAVHNPEHCFEAIHMNTVKRLQPLCASEEDFVRERVVMILKSLVQMDEGRESFLINSTAVDNLKLLLQDSNCFVSLKARELLHSLASNFFCTQILYEMGFMYTLMGRLSDITKKALSIDLDTMKLFLELDVKEAAYELGAILIFLDLILEHTGEIAAKSLSCLALLLQHSKGKTFANKGFVPGIVVGKLQEENEDLQTKAAACIMFMTQTTEGKITAFKMRTHNKLIELAKLHWNPELQINCFKALTNIAEVPEGRQALLKLQNQIKLIPFAESHSDILNHYRNTLLTVINFKP